MSRKKHLRVKEKLDNIIKDNCNQYCYNCKHTLYFNPRERKKNCDYCGALNKNKKGQILDITFIKQNKKWKIIKLLNWRRNNEKYNIKKDRGVWL